MTAIRLVKPYKIWQAGSVIPEMPGNLARNLMQRGIAELATPPVKAMQSPIDRMIRRKVTKAA